MFARTAIETINWRDRRDTYDPNNEDDVYQVWSKLYSDKEYAIDMVALHLIYLKNVTDKETGGLLYKTQKDVFARYNGTGDNAQRYGEAVYNYYMAFKEYNSAGE